MITLTELAATFHSLPLRHTSRSKQSRQLHRYMVQAKRLTVDLVVGRDLF